jgi:membrane-associated protease RseP (regulator of RpoE activity)
MYSYTVVNHGNEMIFRGELNPGRIELLEQYRTVIRSSGGSFYIEEIEGKKFLIVTFPRGGVSRKRSYINFLLFLATVLSTLLVGAILEGESDLYDLRTILSGLPFSITIMGILGLHELGHYFAARRYGLDVSLPYFIPFPTLLGTLGAFIKLRSPIHNKKMLLEIGAAGPVAGFIASVPAVIYGLSLSTVQEIPVEGVDGISLGSSLLFSFLERLVIGTVQDGQELFLHPIAFAGWAGFFVTALNLLPIGQLDGGHVSYALFGSLQRRISGVFFIFLIPLGFLWPGWLIWIALIIILIKIPHPPVIFEDVPLGKRRRILGWVVIGIFVLTFIPTPIDM